MGKRKEGSTVNITMPPKRETECGVHVAVELVFQGSTNPCHVPVCAGKKQKVVIVQGSKRPLEQGDPTATRKPAARRFHPAGPTANGPRPGRLSRLLEFGIFCVKRVSCWSFFSFL